MQAQEPVSPERGTWRRTLTLPRSPLAVAINALRKRESRQRAKQLKKNIMVEEGSSGRDSLQEHGFSRVGSDECKTLRAQGPPTRRLKVAECGASRVRSRGLLSLAVVQLFAHPLRLSRLAQRRFFESNHFH